LEFGFYLASPKPSIICLHISAGEHPVSLICAILLPIISEAIWDIILGIAFVAAIVKTAPASAPKEATRKYLALEELGGFIDLVLYSEINRNHCHHLPSAPRPPVGAFLLGKQPTGLQLRHQCKS